MGKIGHLEIIAKRKAGNIDGWEAYRFECVGSDAIMVTGGIPETTKTGKKRWRGKGHVEIVLQSEIETEKHRYESDTGKCAECFGTGQEFAKWSVSNGTEYRTCHKCDGNGRISLLGTNSDKDTGKPQ